VQKREKCDNNALAASAAIIYFYTLSFLVLPLLCGITWRLRWHYKGAIFSPCTTIHTLRSSFSPHTTTRHNWPISPSQQRLQSHRRERERDSQSFRKCYFLHLSQSKTFGHNYSSRKISRSRAKTYFLSAFKDKNTNNFLLPEIIYLLQKV